MADEFLEDEPALRTYLDTRLNIFVRRAEEEKLLNGAGGSDITGLTVNAGSATAADVEGINMFDAILAGMTSVRRDGGLEPDGVALNAVTWAKMAAAKAVDSGDYYSGGPYQAAARNPWGLRSVITEAMGDDEVLVGAFREGATVFRRGGITIEASNSHSDYFQKNLTALRAEERLALAIFRPQAFVVCTVGS